MITEAECKKWMDASLDDQAEFLCDVEQGRYPTILSYVAANGSVPFFKIIWGLHIKRPDLLESLDIETTDGFNLLELLGSRTEAHDLFHLLLRWTESSAVSEVRIKRLVLLQALAAKQNEDGNTLLHRIILNGNKTKWTTLLELTDLRIRNHDRKNVLDLIYIDHNKIFDTLLPFVFWKYIKGKDQRDLLKEIKHSDGRSYPTIMDYIIKNQKSVILMLLFSRSPSDDCRYAMLNWKSPQNLLHLALEENASLPIFRSIVTAYQENGEKLLAALNQKNKDGLTVWQVVAKKNSQCFELLIKGLSFPFSYEGTLMLDLSGVLKSCRTLAKAVQIIKNIPPGIMELRLNGNQLHLKKIKEIITLLSGVSKEVLYLNLSENHLERKSLCEWMKLLSALPPTLTYVALESNRFLLIETVREGLKTLVGSQLDKYLVELQHQIDSLRKKPSDRLDSLIHFQMRLYDTLYYYLETKDNDLFLETCQILMSEAPVLPASGFLQMKPAPAFKMVLDEIRRREGRSDNLSSQSSVSIR